MTAPSNEGKSDTVKRYDCGTNGFRYCHGCYTMNEEELGDWVRYEDYAALQSQLALVEGERDRLREEVKQLKEWRDGRLADDEDKRIERDFSEM